MGVTGTLGWVPAGKVQILYLYTNWESEELYMAGWNNN